MLWGRSIKIMKEVNPYLDETERSKLHEFYARVWHASWHCTRWKGSMTLGTHYNEIPLEHTQQLKKLILYFIVLREFIKRFGTALKDVRVFFVVV